MGFNEWWALYPRKVSKLVAMKAYDQMLKKGYTHAELLAGIKRYIAELERLGTAREFVPYPASWLRAGRWLDENQSRSVSSSDDTIRESSAPTSGFAGVLSRKLGDALFQAYFRDCSFTGRTVLVPSQARKDYILNKFAYRFQDEPLDVRVQE